MPQGRYVSLAPSTTGQLLYAAKDPPAEIHLESANGRVVRWEARGHEVALRVEGHVPLAIEIGGGKGRCRLRTAYGVVAGARQGAVTRFSLTYTDTGEATLVCG
jgi:hypothetical protein